MIEQGFADKARESGQIAIGIDLIGKSVASLKMAMSELEARLEPTFQAGRPQLDGVVAKQAIDREPSELAYRLGEHFKEIDKLESTVRDWLERTQL